MTDYRCPKCNHLFFKANIIGSIEVGCPKCGYLYKLDKLGNFTLVIDDRLPTDAFVLTQFIKK